jgi:hypothetical protein
MEYNRQKQEVIQMKLLQLSEVLACSGSMFLLPSQFLPLKAIFGMITFSHILVRTFGSSNKYP